MLARPSFDSMLPFEVTASEINVGGRVMRMGDPLPWKQMGLTENVVFDLWRAGFVSHPMPDTQAPESPTTEAPPGETLEQPLTAEILADVGEQIDSSPDFEEVPAEPPATRTVQRRKR